MADREHLEAVLAAEATSFSGHFGLAARRIEGESPLLYHADDIFPTASIIKLVLVAEYLAQVEAGRLNPQQTITLRAADQVGGSGVLQDLSPGLQLPLQDLATLTITISDNLASNLLLEQVGSIEAINTRLQALGMHQTTMGRPFIFDSEADNLGSPADFLHFLLLLARRQLITPARSQQLLDLMSRQQYLDFIPRYLPYHPFAVEYGLPSGLTIANKVGMLRGVINDAALITTPTVTYGLVIFSRDCGDDQAGADNEGALLVARLSRLVYNYVTNDH